MNVACPECTHVYRVDPARVGGVEVRTRCRECGAPFHVATDPEEAMAGTVATVRPAPHSAPERHDATASASDSVAPAPPTATPSPGPGAPVFGPQDPQTRARRLARALVSDIKVYNQKRWADSRAAGTLRKDFRDEIMKSWDEYVEQVGEGMAKGTPFFRDALNDILGGGERVF